MPVRRAQQRERLHDDLGRCSAMSLIVAVSRRRRHRGQRRHPPEPQRPRPASAPTRRPKPGSTTTSSTCTTTPTTGPTAPTSPDPNAVNQDGSTAKRRPVPGNTGGTYAIELLPADRPVASTPSAAPATPAPSMLEPTRPAEGDLPDPLDRLRRQTAKVSIVATFKPASFLDYVYFTQRETSDPVTYGFPNPLGGSSTAPTRSAAKRSRKVATTAPIPTDQRILRHDLLRRRATASKGRCTPTTPS